MIWYDQGWVLAEHQIHVPISHNSLIYLILKYPSNNILLKLSIASVPTEAKMCKHWTSLNFSFPGLVKTFPCLGFFSDWCFLRKSDLSSGVRNSYLIFVNFFHTIQPILPQNSKHCNNKNQILQQSNLKVFHIQFSPQDKQPWQISGMEWMTYFEENLARLDL